MTINGVKDIFPILGEYRLFVIMEAKNRSLLYSLVDALRAYPKVASIWHLLISRENIPSSEEFVCPEINKFVELDTNSSLRNCCEAANLGHLLIR